jgi:hypothetical protein
MLGALKFDTVMKRVLARPTIADSGLSAHGRAINALEPNSSP